MLTTAEISALSLAELEKEIQKESATYFEIQMAIRLRQERNTAKKQKQQRYVARLETARTQKLSTSSLPLAA